MKFVTSDGVEIDYQVTGNSRPLVFVAGFGGYQEVWSEQVAYFAEMGYQVITYDHRNFGKSQRTSKGHTMKRLTQDLVELMQYLKIDQTVFVGHSMGASILYNLIKTYPELIKLAVCVDQTPYMLNTDTWKYGFMNYMAENYQTEIKKIPRVHETLNGLSSKVVFALSQAKSLHPFKRSENYDLLGEHVKSDWRTVIKTTQVPIEVIAAKQSPYYNSDFAKWMSKQNKLVESRIIDNCGHDIMAEVPESFNQILRHYLLKNRYLSN